MCKLVRERAESTWKALKIVAVHSNALHFRGVFVISSPTGFKGFFKMAQHHETGPAELGAPMDYAEHEKTYAFFISMSKWGTVACVALMIAMAFGFFSSAGFFSATILFFLVMAVAWFVL